MGQKFESCRNTTLNYFLETSTWYYADSSTKRAKGVAVGLAAGVRFKLEERMTDPEGRYLGEMECTLADIYAPNKNSIKYMKDNGEVDGF